MSTLVAEYHSSGMMAKQEGFIKFRSSVGGLTFYQTADGDLVRRTGGISKERILMDKAFQRPRENMSEFVLMAAAVKYLRTSVGSMLNKVKDGYLGRRLFSLFSR